MSTAPPDLSRLRIERVAGGGSGAGWWVALVLALLFTGYVSWREGWVPERYLPDALAPVDRRPAVTLARVIPAGAVEPESGVAANGYVVARRRAALSTDIQGRIVELLVEEGDHVQQGQLIARLDTRQLEASLNNARAEQQRQQAALRKARLDFQRFDNLVASGEVSVSERDNAQAAQDEAQASLDALAARVAEIEVMIDKSSVFAPFAGVITAKDAEVGEVVAALGANGPSSRGAVATLVDFDTLEVQVELAQTALSAASVGAPARIYLDAWPDHAYPGRVRQIWPTANRQKATVEVRIVFLERDERILPEMGVRVVFGEPRAEGEQAAQPLASVPERALLHRGGQTAVLLVVEGRIQRRLVTLAGEARDGRVPLVGGLAGGEQVVLDPDPALADGTAVREAAVP